MAKKKTEVIDWFAQREEDSYKDEARNILDSYAHPWDILVELAQNAVDAIEMRRTENDEAIPGLIGIDINQQTRTICVKDNGIGIGDADLTRVLKPHYSRKRGRSLRGEKGVGLTYIALMGNRFQIVTKTNRVTRQLSVQGSQDWIGGKGERPQLHVDQSASDAFPDEQSCTLMTVAEIPESAVDSDDLDIFGLTFDQMEYLLRSRTAIGWTGTLFGLPLQVPMHITLTLHRANGSSESRAIPFSYASPEERMPRKSIVTLDEVKEHLGNDEARKIYGKAIRFHKTFISKGGKDIRVYCLLMSRHEYNQQTESLSLPEDLRIQGGIFIATKGMPTGIVLQPPKTGRAGYWPNFYMVIEYDTITLDLGRKSITAPRVIEMLSKQAAQVFNDVDRYVKFTIREDEGTLDALTSQNELQQELTEIKAESQVLFEDSRTGKPLADRYPVLRHPRQEQDLVSLFSMMLARGVLPYEILRISSNYRYDCFLRYQHDKKALYVVSEFKFDGESILKDLEDAKARYGQLHLLICWKMDEAKLRQRGFLIDGIGSNKRELPGATHKLSFPSSVGIKDQPIAVICLSQLLSVS